ncbi:putative leader peptide [Sphaerisporangium krabiense]|uniref:Uncharacterized protein n=1 Tax=Sphaerisporangium krabiense TaxID=763782 RepID=A0A7W8YZP9_9ACTN|nr:putative leader peptide [Sphaerisporangium krabiense]MBB5624766.1 hypothetical protein [Sphaerisporangium krabiense]
MKKGPRQLTCRRHVDLVRVSSALCRPRARHGTPRRTASA